MTKTIATLVGCGISDALGKPFEMKSPHHPKLQAWDGLFAYGATFGRTPPEPGRWTDDTKMTIALATSLIRKQGFDPGDVATEYLAWLNSGDNRGMGSTTAQALGNLKLGASWKESGLVGEKVGGNGTAMRASPLGLLYRDRIAELIKVAMQDASITHNSFEPKIGSIAVAVGTAVLCNGATPREAFDYVRDLLPTSKVRDKLELVHGILETNPNGDFLDAAKSIGASGYVVETVGAAYYCLLRNKSFKDTVVMAVKFGQDADTTAAVAGALAGTYYGLEGIPPEYHSVEDFDILNSLTEQLLAITL